MCHGNIFNSHFFSYRKVVFSEALSQKAARSSGVQRRTTSVLCRPSPRGITSQAGSFGPMDLPRPTMPRPQRGLLACCSERAVGFQRCTPLQMTGNQGTRRKNRALVSDNIFSFSFEGILLSSQALTHLLRLQPYKWAMP